MGEVFAGRFELLDPIATGGMGTVWRVVDREGGQVLAAKILRQSDAASLLRFVREQSLRIDHTHVVTPLSWAGLDDRVLFTMPLMRGGSVTDLLAARSGSGLPVRWVALLLDQTLQALEAVHAAGIVHRDVKPGNLLLEPTGAGAPHLRLTDFGIAVPVHEPRLTRASSAIGTPGYMPPEQWRGADPDPRADLFALGRVAVEMLTGRRPSAEPHEAPDLAALRTGEPARDALLDVVAVVTAERPEDRPATAAAFRTLLLQRGLLDLPADPGDGVVVPDRYGDRATAGAGRATAPTTPTMPPPRHPPPTRFLPAGPPPRRAPALGAVLLAVGIAGLIAALWLLLG